MGKFVSNIDEGGQVGVPVMDRPHTLVQYQYEHGTLSVLAFNKGASTGIGIIHWFSTSMGTFHYRYWHPNMVPILILAFLHFGSVLVWHSPLPPLLAFRCVRTGIGKYVLGISTNMGIFHYRNWNSIVPIPVLAFLHFCSVPVWADSITGTDNQ
jgi:hypothetical protein